MIDKLALHRELLRCRRAEELIAKLYRSQEMRTPVHLAVGQEAVSVGVCAALDPHDVVYSHHRSHLAYLARGGSFYRLVAELYGKEDGCSKGRGGSVHLTARDKGFVISSAILGQTVAVATGSAMAFKMDRKRNVAVTFCGDAVCEEGVFYESLNFASLHRLPVIYVCENNLYSTESPLNKRQAPRTDLCVRAHSFKVQAIRVDGNDVDAMVKGAQWARALAVSGQPVFLECMTYRWLEHVGPDFDHDLGRRYRDVNELREWQKKCPVKRSAEKIITEGIASQAVLDAMDAEVSEALEKEAIAARESAPAHGLMEYV